jgi:hypothetical protein
VTRPYGDFHLAYTKWLRCYATYRKINSESARCLALCSYLLSTWTGHRRPSSHLRWSQGASMVEAVTRACTVPKFRGSATYPQLQSCTSLPLCTVLQESGLYKLGIKLLKGTPIQNLHLHQKFSKYSSPNRAIYRTSQTDSHEFHNNYHILVSLWI